MSPNTPQAALAGCRAMAPYIAVIISVVVGGAFILLILETGIGFYNRVGGGGNPGGAGGPSPTPTSTPAPGNTIPTISARTYTAGSTPVTVTGTFSFSSTIALHIPDAFSDGVETTLSYGFQLESGGVLLGFSQRPGADGFSLNVNYGTWMATYIGEGCTWEVEVTDVTLSGHVSCTDIPAVSEPDGTPGVVDIELDFTADSPPETD